MVIYIWEPEVPISSHCCHCGGLTTAFCMALRWVGDGRHWHIEFPVPILNIII